MREQRFVHDDDEKGGIDIYRITRGQLTLLGLTPKQVNLYDPDELIRLYEMTFVHVGPDEYGSLDKRKHDIWHIRWAVAHRLPEVLAQQKAQGINITRHLDWLHKQLVRKFYPPTKHQTFWERFWNKVFDCVFGAIGPSEQYLDNQVLSEFLFSMGYYDIFNEHTWKYLLKMRGHLRSEGYVHYLLLIGKVYTKFYSPKLKRYLEEQAAQKEGGDERQNALINTARVILKDKKLKMVSPPYSVGIAAVNK